MIEIHSRCKYAEISYDHEGKPICHICGKSFKKLMTHVWQKHNMSAYDYKKTFGLETTKGIMCQESVEIARLRNKQNYDKVVKENLLTKGEPKRFQIGWEGRTKDKVSPMTRKKLKENISRTPTHLKNKRGEETNE